MKIIKVKSCKECPLTILQRCTMKPLTNDEYKYIPNREWKTIPEWCPLEDYKNDYARKE